MIRLMDTPVLMPEPNYLRYLSGFLEVDREEAIDLSPGALDLAPELVGHCRRVLGLVPAAASPAATAPLRLKRLDAQDLDRAREAFDIDGPAVLREESYLVWPEPGAITVSAADGKGFLHALQTLGQLTVARDGRRTCRLKRAIVFDCPHLAIRGVHVYLPAREHLEYCRRFVDALAGLKYNRIYFEVSGMEYKRHPEINQAWAEYARDMDEYPEKAKAYQNGSHCAERPWYKDSIHLENAGGGFLRQEEVRGLVSYCTERMVEVVPEVQSLSHCDYLVIPHREIAELPDDPYPDSYCPSNPRSYELLFDVIDEVLDVFGPQTVHIGHDEWYSAGYCPVCRTKDAAELLAGDVTRIHDYLASRGVRTEMWGDKLLDAHTPDGRGQGGAYRIVENYQTSEVYNTLAATHEALDRIPADVRIGHWYWSLEPGAVDRFGARGMDVLYANFSGPDIRDWETCSRKRNVIGGYLSHWDLLQEDNMAREGILANIVYSSYPLWNARYGDRSWEKVRDLTLEFMPAFMERLTGRVLPSRAAAPRDMVTFPLEHERRDALYMDTAFVELRCHRETVIQHRDRRGYHRGARVAEVWRAQSFRIALVDERVDSLVFRHTTSIRLPYRSAGSGYRPEDYRIGYYTIRYSDGERETVELSYGYNISSADLSWGRASQPFSYAADVALSQVACHTRPWSKTLNDGDHVTVYDYEWLNPHPQKIVESIDLSLVDKGVAYSVLVYGIHGVRLRARKE